MMPVDVRGEVTMTRGELDVIIRGRGHDVEIEIPGIFWALRNLDLLRAFATGAVGQAITPLQTSLNLSTTFRTRHRPWLTIYPQTQITLLGWLGFLNARVRIWR